MLGKILTDLCPVVSAIAFKKKNSVGSRSATSHALVSTQVFVPEARRKLAGGGAAARTPGGWQNVPLALKGRQTRHRLTPFQGWGLNGNGSGGCACAPPPANLPCPSGTKTSFPTCVETNAAMVAWHRVMPPCFQRGLLTKHATMAGCATLIAEFYFLECYNVNQGLKYLVGY